MGGNLPYEAGLIKKGDKVLLVGLQHGKYAKRVVGDLLYQTKSPGGVTVLKSLTKTLIEQGHAVPYDGGTKAAWWCEGRGE